MLIFNLWHNKENKRYQTLIHNVNNRLKSGSFILKKFSDFNLLLTLCVNVLYSFIFFFLPQVKDQQSILCI